MALKYVIDLTRLNIKITGLERFASMISYNLIKNSDDDFVLVFAGDIHPMFQEFTSSDRVEFVVLKKRRKILFELFTVPHAISRIPADKYLFLAFPVPPLFFKRNTLCAIHDLGCWDCPETMVVKFVLYFRLALWTSSKKCTDIITVSNYTKTRIVDKLKHKPENIHVIYNGVSKTFFNTALSESRKKAIRDKYNLPNEYLLCLSTIQPRKNMEILLQACKELWDDGKLDLPLVLAGESGWKNQDIYNSNSGKLIMTGYVDEEDLPCIYNMAKVFVFPSIYEGFGIPPLEAMAAGTPVLSSNGPCMPEILGEAAMYFENNNRDDLKVKIQQIISSDNIKKIELGKNRASSFNWNDQAQQLLSVLKEC